MSQRAFASIRLLPIAWAAIVIGILAIPFWQIPWAFIDVYNNFYIATTLSWSETIAYAFSRGLEYRPLLTILVKVAHQTVGLREWAYQLLVLLQFALILGLLLRLFKPEGTPRVIAACIAVCCVAGLHTSRVLFMFAPLNAHSLGVVLLLLAAALALDDRARRVDWLFLPLTFVALLLLESGVLIIPVLVVLRVLRSSAFAEASADRPAVGWLGVGASVVAVALYAAVRLTFGSQADTAATYTETGLGFESLESTRLAAVFERAPWMLWVYNIIASFLTVVASEPRAGRFILIDKLLQAETPIWLSIHVGSSVLTSAVIAWALAKARSVPERDRWLAGIGLTVLIAGSGLGFLYARDRIAVSAGVGYAVLVYVGVSVLLERATGARQRTVATVIVGMIAAGWAVRTGEAYLQLRDSAWENYVEWTDRYPSLGGARPQTDVLRMLRETTLASTPDDPRLDPDWTYVLFEREFER